MDETNELTEMPRTVESSQDLGERKRRARRHEVQDEIPPGATARRAPDRLADALEHARICARIAEDNRAKDIVVLDLRTATPLFDYFVIATASSRRQANTIVSEIDAEMKKIKEYKLGMEGSEEGRWVLIDYGDFVVHIFSDDARSYYALEDIWGDAPRIDWRGDPPASFPETAEAESRPTGADQKPDPA